MYRNRLRFSSSSMNISTIYWEILQALGDLRACLSPKDLRERLRAAAATARVIALAKGARGASIARTARVIAPERLRLGVGVVIQDFTVLHCGGQEWCDSEGMIEIGDRSFVGHSCVFYGSGGLRIGRNVLIAPQVVITSQGHEVERNVVSGQRRPLVFGPVTIEDDAWLAASATILPGVTIGKGSVVAAGAVVTRNVPERCLVAGVPAKIVKAL